MGWGNKFVKKNKYGVSDKSKRTCDGIIFASKKEKDRYNILKMLEKEGHITCLTLQPKYLLQKGFERGDKKIRAIYYVADFSYLDVTTGNTVVEDTKGFRTNEYLLKKKMFLYNYPKYDFVEL